MDASITRNGRPCWYRVEGVSNIAINDACMLESALYQLLKRHFRKESYYTDLLELFLDVSGNSFANNPSIDRPCLNQTTYKAEMGGLIDLVTAPENHVDLSKFSLERLVIWIYDFSQGYDSKSDFLPSYRLTIAYKTANPS
jgi:farnesyl diphosphate synthase